jgi:hypothetical protein
LAVRGSGPHLLAVFEHFPDAARDLGGLPLSRIRCWLLNRLYDSSGLPSGLADWRAGILLFFLQAWLGDG